MLLPPKRSKLETQKAEKRMERIGCWMVFLLLLALFLLWAWDVTAPIRFAGKKLKARSDIQAIATAINHFYKDYGKLPGCTHFIDGNTVLINELRATSAAMLNTNRTVYLEPSRKKVSPAGDLLDPWGRPYQVYLDIGLAPDKIANDGNIDIGYGDGLARYRTRVIVISSGPNQESGDGDDVSNVKQF